MPKIDYSKELEKWLDNPNKQLVDRLNTADVDDQTKQFLLELLFLANRWKDISKRKVEVVPAFGIAASGYRACSIELRSYLEMFLINLEQHKGTTKDGS